MRITFHGGFVLAALSAAAEATSLLRDPLEKSLA